MWEAYVEGAIVSVGGRRAGADSIREVRLKEEILSRVLSKRICFGLGGVAGTTKGFRAWDCVCSSAPAPLCAATHRQT